MNGLTEDIRRLALDAGFDKVGFSSVGRAQTRLGEWLDRGYHAGMTWMEKKSDVRADPRLWYAEAKSVICLALNYYSEGTPDISAGKISRYAMGEDYHDVMKQKMSGLLEQIRLLRLGIDGRIACDTSPVLDKYWAAQSGIGWQGKHSNVISRDVGSWFFLGEIFVNVELTATVPVEDSCGTCTACLDACPTQAITEPYVVDARRCLSYWTIESKGESFPQDISGRTDGWIFGCDVCQDVCPWNQKFAQPTREPAFRPSASLARLTKEEWDSMTDEEFRKVFRTSPIRRAKLSGMKRNIREAEISPDESGA